MASEAQASTPREAVSITDEEVTHQASSGVSEEEPASMASIDSDMAYNDDGELVQVEPAAPSDLPRGPPVPVPVNAPRLSDEERGAPRLLGERGR